jgi:hypothetical protein
MISPIHNPAVATPDRATNPRLLRQQAERSGAESHSGTRPETLRGEGPRTEQGT